MGFPRFSLIQKRKFDQFLILSSVNHSRTNLLQCTSALISVAWKEMGGLWKEMGGPWKAIGASHCAHAALPTPSVYSQGSSRAEVKGSDLWCGPARPKSILQAETAPDTLVSIHEAHPNRVRGT